jgi:hypothetical protein
MKFTDTNARQWLLDTGIELCSDELFEDGGMLIWWSKSYSPKINEKQLRSIIKTTLHWDEEDINNVILNVKGLQAFA